MTYVIATAEGTFEVTGRGLRLGVAHRVTRNGDKPLFATDEPGTFAAIRKGVRACRRAAV